MGRIKVTKNRICTTDHQSKATDSELGEIGMLLAAARGIGHHRTRGVSQMRLIRKGYIETLEGLKKWSDT